MASIQKLSENLLFKLCACFLCHMTLTCDAVRKEISEICTSIEEGKTRIHQPKAKILRLVIRVPQLNLQFLGLTALD